MAMLIGEEMAVIVGAVETPLKEVLLPENREDFEAAVKKELNEMRKRRFYRPEEDSTKYENYIPIKDLTEKQKR